MLFQLETPRLLIRELLPSDDEGMFELDSDPEVHKYVGKRPVESIQQSREVIEFVRRQYAENGIGRWAVLDKHSNDFLGWVGFKWLPVDAGNRVGKYDFGYRLIRRCWNKGIATESSIACLGYGIGQLGFRDIYAMTDVHNGGSRRVLEKLGFQLTEIFRFDSNPGWRTEEDLSATFYKLPDTAFFP